MADKALTTDGNWTTMSSVDKTNDRIPITDAGTGALQDIAPETLVTDAIMTTTDVTTNDVSTSKHGFVPKAPNDTTKFLRGDASWSTVSSSVIKQVVNTQTGAVATGTTTLPLDDTIPQNTEGNEYMTLAITPTSATNKLLIQVTWNGTNSAAGSMGVALFQDTTANALAAGFARIEAAASPECITLSHYMTAGTTSSTTFKVRAGLNNAGTTTFNGTGGARIYGGVMASSITITEIVV